MFRSLFKLQPKVAIMAKQVNFRHGSKHTHPSKMAMGSNPDAFMYYVMHAPNETVQVQSKAGVWVDVDSVEDAREHLKD